MEGLEAHRRAASIDNPASRIDQVPSYRSPEEARRAALLVTPEAMEELVRKFEQESNAAHSQTSHQTPKDTTAEQPQAAAPWGVPGANFQHSPADAHRSGNTCEGPLGGYVPPDQASPPDESQASAAAAEPGYWAEKLNEQTRADTQRRASLANHRRERFDKLQQLSKRAQAGDKTAVIEIHQQLDADEDFWRCYGDAGVYTEPVLIKSIAGGSVAIEESIRRNVADMKQSLLGEASTSLEAMTVGRVIACWLFLQFIDRCSTLALQQELRSSDLSRLQETAEKRYQTSLRSLKLVQGIYSPASRLARRGALPSVNRAATASEASAESLAGPSNPAAPIARSSAGATTPGVDSADARTTIET